MKHFSKKAEDALNLYDWPGNVRELENAIEYLVNIVKGDLIEFYHLPYSIKESIKNTKAGRKATSLKDIVDNYEKQVLESYLKQYGSTTKDKEHISKLLSIDLSTLYRKLAKHNLQ